MFSGDRTRAPDPDTFGPRTGPFTGSDPRDGSTTRRWRESEGHGSQQDPLCISNTTSNTVYPRTESRFIKLNRASDSGFKISKLRAPSGGAWVAAIGRDNNHAARLANRQLNRTSLCHCSHTLTAVTSRTYGKLDTRYKGLFIPPPISTKSHLITNDLISSEMSALRVVVAAEANWVVCRESTKFAAAATNHSAVNAHDIR